MQIKLVQKKKKKKPRAYLKGDREYISALPTIFNPCLSSMSGGVADCGCVKLMPVWKLTASEPVPSECLIYQRQRQQGIWSEGWAKTSPGTFLKAGHSEGHPATVWEVISQAGGDSALGYGRQSRDQQRCLGSSTVAWWRRVILLNSDNFGGTVQRKLIFPLEGMGSPFEENGPRWKWVPSSC